MSKKKFHLGDVLSVTGDRLVSPRLIDGVYEVMNFLSGESLFTHELLIYKDPCRTEILKQHPRLALIDDSGVNRGNWREWLNAQVKEYGREIELEQTPLHIAPRSHPIESLSAMVGKKNVVVVEVK